MTDQIPAADWDKLTPEARSFLCQLAGERSGLVVEEIAEKLGVVTAAVRAFSFLDDNGTMKGPKGSLTLTLTIGPDPDGPDMVKVVDKIVYKHPADRGHSMYVGRRNTLHTRQSTEDALFAVNPTEGGAVAIEYPPDRAAGPDD